MATGPSFDKAQREGWEPQEGRPQTMTTKREACPRASSSLLLMVGLALLLATSCGPQPSRTNAPASNESGAAAPPSRLKKDHLTYADRVAWRAALKWPQDCEESFDDSDKSLAGLEFFELSAKHYLVQVTCDLGAYQGTYSFLLLDESRVPSASKLLRFVNYEDSGEAGSIRLQKEETAQLAGLPEFDAATKELRVFDKFRGPGDCGVLATYSFSNDQPTLALLQGKLECDGKGPFDPQQWKKINPP